MMLCSSSAIRADPRRSAGWSVSRRITVRGVRVFHHRKGTNMHRTAGTPAPTTAQQPSVDLDVDATQPITIFGDLWHD